VLIVKRGVSEASGTAHVVLFATTGLTESRSARDRGMLTSHQAALNRARAGQLAARELEVQRISGALRRADELDDDVAAPIEAA
jgi:hypothetical protein